jgi:hypothetical protein
MSLTAGPRPYLSYCFRLGWLTWYDMCVICCLFYLLHCSSKGGQQGSVEN